MFTWKGREALGVCMVRASGRRWGFLDHRLWQAEEHVRHHLRKGHHLSALLAL